MNEFLLEGKQLENALRRIQRAVAYRPTLQVLGCVKFQSHRDGSKYSVSATNLEIYIREVMDNAGDVGTNGKWVVKYPELGRFVRATEAEAYQFRFTSDMEGVVNRRGFVGILAVRAIRARGFISEDGTADESPVLNLKVWDPQEWPTFDFIDRGHKISRPEDLLNALGACLPAASPDESRPVLNGVRLLTVLKPQPPEWQVVKATAADGFRLVRWERQASEGPTDDRATVIMPLPAARAIRALFTEKDEICYEPTGADEARPSFFVLRNEKTMLASMGIPHRKYPDLQSVIDGAGGLVQFALSPHHLFPAIRVARAITKGNEKGHLLSIAFDAAKTGPTMLWLHALNSDTGSRARIPLIANCIREMPEGHKEVDERMLNPIYLDKLATSIRAAFGRKAEPLLLQCHFGSRYTPMRFIMSEPGQVCLESVIMPMHGEGNLLKWFVE